MEHMEHKKSSNTAQKKIQWAMESDEESNDYEEEHMIEEKHNEKKQQKHAKNATKQQLPHQQWK
eukprot:6962087-Ditylum_brightwellii.AAC.1